MPVKNVNNHQRIRTGEIFKTSKIYLSTENILSGDSISSIVIIGVWSEILKDWNWHCILKLTFPAHALHWKFETNIPWNETAWPRSQFLHSCICERFIHSMHDRSANTIQKIVWPIMGIQGASGIDARFLKLSPASTVRAIMTKFLQCTAPMACSFLSTTAQLHSTHRKGGRGRKIHSTSTREWGHSCLARGYCV
jgi:hypothetical protein